MPSRSFSLHAAGLRFLLIAGKPMNAPVVQVSTRLFRACVQCWRLRVRAAASGSGPCHPVLSCCTLFWRQHGACGFALLPNGSYLRPRSCIAAALIPKSTRIVFQKSLGESHGPVHWLVHLNLAPVTYGMCLPTAWAFCVMYTREEIQQASEDFQTSTLVLCPALLGSQAICLRCVRSTRAASDTFLLLSRLANSRNLTTMSGQSGRIGKVVSSSS